MHRHDEDWNARWDPEPRRPSTGKQLARFLILLGLAFAITAAVVVTQRLSQDSLALLIGLSCGIAAMLPALVLGFAIWRRDETRRREEEQQREMQQRPPGYNAPPIIVVTPQGMPGYGYPQQQALPPDSSWAPAHGQRDFKIVGGDE